MASIENTVEIAADVHEVYEAWMAFERYPTFMETVERVALAHDRLHWVAAVEDDTFEWDADLVESVLDEKVWWRAVDGREAGEVRFERLGVAKTKVTYQLAYDPAVWEADADSVKLWMQRRVGKDLSLFKTMVEALAAHDPHSAAGQNRTPAAPLGGPPPAGPAQELIAPRVVNPSNAGAAAGGAVPAGPPPYTTSWLFAYGLLAVGALAGWGLWEAIKPKGFVPAPGVSIFAALYIFAQCIERVMEPFSSSFGRANVEGKKITKKTALQDLAAKPDDPAKQEAVEQVRRNRAVILWGVSSLLAMLASGALGLFLLKSVGLKGVPVWVDILVTGLAIGSGTKPLHDLISNIQQSSSAKEKAATTKAS